jgi:hypothetical protein
MDPELQEDEIVVDQGDEERREIDRRRGDREQVRLPRQSAEEGQEHQDRNHSSVEPEVEPDQTAPRLPQQHLGLRKIADDEGILLLTPRHNE